MEPVTSDTGYVARYGFDRRTLLMLLAFMVFVVVMAARIMANDGTNRDMIILLVVCGMYALVFLATRGKVAFRVDPHGITLHTQHRTWFGTDPLEFAWGDVTEVVLFETAHKVRGVRRRFPCVGVRLRPEVRDTAPGNAADSGLRPIPRQPHVPDDIAVRSQLIMGWWLDERLLCDIMARHAPGVRLVRLNRTGQPHPVCAA